MHLGHENIAKYRGLSSEEENYEALKENWHKVVTKRDTVILLGDICFTEDRLKDFMTWKSEQKILVAGNHDTQYMSMATLTKYYDKVYSLLKYKGMWLSHAPIHPEELRGRTNVHGHGHYKVIDDPRYLNVCVEQTEMTPANIELVKQVFISRGILPWKTS